MEWIRESWHIAPGAQVVGSVTLMKRPLLTIAILASFGVAATHAQTSGGTAVVQPSSPAPVVKSPPPSDPAIAAPNPNEAPPRVTQTVYTPALPSAAELTQAAAAQGLTVERIVQTSSQLIAFYRNASGQPITVAYQTLPPAGAQPAAAPAAETAPRVVVVSPPQTVVYESAPRVIYYDSPYYYPRVWYPPVSLSFGFGYRSFHGGPYHGGFRHR